MLVALRRLADVALPVHAHTPISVGLLYMSVRDLSSLVALIVGMLLVLAA